MSPSWEQRVLSQKLAEQSKDSEESQPPQDTTSAPEPQSSILPAGESFIARLAKRLRKNNHPKDLTGVPQVKARWPFNWISRKSTLPLYTSSLGKSALIATADVASATIETIRGGHLPAQVNKESVKPKKIFWKTDISRLNPSCLREKAEGMAAQSFPLPRRTMD